MIRSNISGDEVREYAVEILKTIPDAPDGRELVISVTDPELIAATGGIVQGMSGSPHSSKWAAGWRCDPCAAERPNQRVWNFRRNYAEHRGNDVAKRKTVPADGSNENRSCRKAGAVFQNEKLDYSAEGLATRNSISLPPSLSGK